MSQRYVIIGCGAAGMTAAVTIRKQDPEGAVWIVTGDRNGYYSRPGLAYYLAGEVPESQLYPFPGQHWKDLGLRWHIEQVSAIHPGEHLVEFKSGKTLPYEKLLLATGASAQMPDTPGIKLEGVVKLDDMDEARRILRLAKRGATAVVVGGGITALELVEGLAECGMRVHYFLRGDRYWSGVLDETESRIVEDRLKKMGILIHYYTNLVEIQGSKERVEKVLAKEGEEELQIPCRIVAVAIGVKPRKELAEKAGLGVKRGILATRRMQTTDQDIYTAGDAAEVIDPHTGESTIDSLWHPAIEMGKIAGKNMTGESLEYNKRAAINVTRLAGLVTTIIGQIASQKDAGKKDRDLPNAIMRGDSETWREMPDAIVAQSYGGGNRLRIYIQQDHLAGALLMGDQSVSRPLQHIIWGKTDITSIRDALLAPDAPLVDIIFKFWQESLVRHALEVA